MKGLQRLFFIKPAKKGFDNKKNEPGWAKSPEHENVEQK